MVFQSCATQFVIQRVLHCIQLSRWVLNLQRAPDEIAETIEGESEVDALLVFLPFQLEGIALVQKHLVRSLRERLA
jgi:hypothetical protein